MKLSLRDYFIIADTKDSHHEVSEVENGNPKKHYEILNTKPQIDINIKIDPERDWINQNLAMGLNARNQLLRTKNID